MRALASWWDGAELWLVGLPFAAQVTIMMVVVLPLCAGAAVVLDRGIGALAALLGSRTRREQRDE